MRSAPALAVLVLALAALPAAPPAVGTEAAQVLDLTETFPSGAYRAYRVRLLEPASLEFGGVYANVATEQPVLPLLATVEREDSMWTAMAVFAYDFRMFNQNAAAYAVLRTPAATQTQGVYQVFGGGWSTTSPADPGVYRIVVATAPAGGDATARIKVFGAAEVLAADQGTSFFARGLDHSAVAYDAHVWAKPSLYGRVWGYSGADVAMPVQGRMYGYLGYHEPTEAHWVSPDGNAEVGFVVGGAAGSWTASFPAESWEGPVCLRGCSLFGDTREDPPFAIGADVKV